MEEDFDPIRHTRDGYNTIANEWDQTRQQPWTEVNSYIEEYLQDRQKIIDVGCGNGRALFLLKNYKIYLS